MDITPVMSSGTPPDVAEVFPLLYLGIGPFIQLLLMILVYFRVQ